MIKKKKSLGQYFLNSASYLNAVADAARINKGETILEIGPGEGALSEVLLERGARVVAVEKDARLIEFLRERFAGKNFTLVEGDALTFEPPFKTYKVVGNIPYYITGLLLRKFLSEDPQPSVLVFLVQKEVAQRITGHPSTSSGSQKESVLSLSVKAYGTPKYIKTIPRGAFSPAPGVDSAILQVQDISRSRFADAAHERRFFDAIKRGFGQKRKFLKSNLGPQFARQFEQLGLPDTVRAEDVPLEAWLALTR